jgi:hypothetical protein
VHVLFIPWARGGGGGGNFNHVSILPCKRLKQGIRTVFFLHYKKFYHFYLSV